MPKFKISSKDVIIMQHIADGDTLIKIFEKIGQSTKAKAQLKIGWQD